MAEQLTFYNRVDIDTVLSILFICLYVIHPQLVGKHTVAGMSGHQGELMASWTGMLSVYTNRELAQTLAAYKKLSCLLIIAVFVYA